MWRYIELLSFESLDTVKQWKQDVEGGRNPRDIKVMFAQEIISRFHDRAAAEKALADFEARFKQGAIPDDIAEMTLDGGEAGLPVTQLLKQAGLVSSTSEAMRQIDGGGVRIDGEKVADKGLVIAKGSTVVAQVGKRKFARVVVQ
jgi:tyrosyl-tRNA synthetase